MIEACESTGIIGYFVDIALSAIHAAGWIGGMLVVMIENVLPFIPSEVILPALGLAAGRGQFPVAGWLGIVITVLLVTVASLIGALILFGVCRLIGKDRISKIPFVKEEGVEKANNWFVKYGDFAVFFCRFIPVVRVLVTIPAGLSKMKISRFAIFTALGSLLWNSVFVGIGAALGSQWCSIEPIFSQYTHITVVVAILILILALFAKHKLMNKDKGDANGDTV